MLLLLSGLALAQDDVTIASARGSEPSLATRLKYGLMAGVPDRGQVRIVRVQLYESAQKLPVEELDRRLATEWVPVGILDTRDHGRLRVTCHEDACVGQAGATTIHLQLLDAPPPTRHRR
jgi:hypothetical protein